MYARTMTLVLTGALLAATAALADETTVIHKDRPAGVVVAPAPGVTVERKKIETNGTGDCRSKTVHKEGMEGSTTVHKEKCD